MMFTLLQPLLLVAWLKIFHWSFSHNHMSSKNVWKRARKSTALDSYSHAALLWKAFVTNCIIGRLYFAQCMFCVLFNYSKTFNTARTSSKAFPRLTWKALKIFPHWKRLLIYEKFHSLILSNPRRQTWKTL